MTCSDKSVEFDDETAYMLFFFSGANSGGLSNAMVDIVKFRFEIFSSEPPKDLKRPTLGPLT